MRQIGVRVSDEMAEAIQNARGDVPLNTWCVRAFEDKLLDPSGSLGLGTRREEAVTSHAESKDRGARQAAAVVDEVRGQEVTPNFKGGKR